MISGYLISGILYKGHLQGNFSPSSFFLEFYARRIRRLFPALITVLILIMSYLWLILLTDEFEQLGKHVAARDLLHPEHRLLAGGEKWENVGCARLLQSVK